MTTPELFFKGIVENIFNRWTALKLSVEHGMGGNAGHQTAIEVMNYVYEYCIKNNDLTPSEIEELLEEIMDQEFETICDDNSTKEIANLLIKYKNMCLEQRYDEITHEQSQLPSCPMWLNAGFKMQYTKVEDSSSSGTDDNDDDDDEDMDVSTEQPAKPSRKNRMEPDEDGWTTVNTRNR